MGWQDAPIVGQTKETKAWENAPIVEEGSDLPTMEIPPQESRQDKFLGKVKENLPLIGSIGGGILGSIASPAGSIALGSALGTILGTSIGTSGKQILEQREGNVKSLKETLGEQVTNISEQTMYDLVGQGIGKGLSKTVEMAAPLIREGAEKAQQTLMRRGGTLTMSQASESPTLGLAESFARAGAGGKGQFIKLEKRNADAMQAIKDSLIQTMSKSPVDDKVAGKLFQNAIKNGEGAHSAAATALYKDFDARVGGELVDMLPVQQAAQKVASDYARIGNVGKSDAGGALIDQLKSIGNTMTYSDAHLLRSNLLARIRDLKAGGQESRAVMIATQFAKQVDEAMETSAKNLSGNLFKEYREISGFYRKGKQAFNNEIVQSLMEKQPERVGEELFKSGNVSEIIQAKASLRQAMLQERAAGVKGIVDQEGKIIKEVTSAKDVMNRLRAGYLNAMLTAKSATTKEGETVATNMLRELATAKSSRQFRAMFSEAQRDSITSFARTAYLVASNKPSQFGILAPILQAGAIADLALGDMGTGNTAASLTVLLSPYVLSKVLTNPNAVNVLTKGLKLPAGTAPTSSVVTKLGAELRHWIENPVQEGNQ